ncbi:RNA polymerase sigma factor [Clostridium aminobutyricum]|uniref:Sigma-70 family RNA polymerase sigma factor n=1 Tax=Clostridium aminobutyricum TaxID=33953 RepID=A0A939D783_CLOAM|nr:sigma-70 family RNA polymerase sigma factor [Clostridium aminobutyricum]MBN7772023.1 sigma-70 family RNA polymerase sigma factor [Clostridium aminobutyricum]
MNDNELILLLKSDPQEGLTKAIDLYGGTVKWIIQKIIGNHCQQDTEECVSDTFVKLWQGIDRFQNDNGVLLKSYLYGIARHTAIDFCRKRNAQEELFPIEENDLGIHVDVTEELAKSENIRILQEAVDALPEPDRKIFIRRYFLQERINAIAESLSISPKVVENKLYRGKKVLKDSLIERGIIL